MKKLARRFLFFLGVVGVLFVALQSSRLLSRQTYAIPGQLSIGASNLNSIQYINQKTIYNATLFFGKDGQSGALTSNGTVEIGNPNPLGSTASAILPPGYVLEVNGRSKQGGVSIGTTDNAYQLEVAGTGPSYGDAARFQGNVGIGQGIAGPFDTPLTILEPVPGAPVLKLKDKTTPTANTVALGLSSTALTVDKALTVSGSGNSSFAGSVGIGTTIPLTKLHVSNGTNVGDIVALTGGSTNYNLVAGIDDTQAYIYNNSAARKLAFGTNSQKNNLVIDTTGNIGIGTSLPNAKLDITGASSLIANTAGNLNITPAGNLIVTQGNVAIGTTTAGSRLTIGTGAVSGAYGLIPGYVAWNTYGTGDGGAAIYNDSGTYKKLMIVGNASAGGQREIGLWDNLTVNNNATVGNIMVIDGGSSSNWASANIGSNGTASINAAGPIYSYGMICSGNSSGACSSTGGVVISPSGSNAYGNTYLTGSGNSYFNGGNVGIGTTGPGYPLHLYNATGETGILTTYGGSNVYMSHGGWGMGAGKFGIGDGTSPAFMVDTATDWIGMGTTVPDSKLDIHVPAGSADVATLHIRTADDGNSSSYVPSILVQNYDNSLFNSAIQAEYNGTSTTSYAIRAFNSSSGGYGLYASAGSGGYGIYNGGGKMYNAGGTFYSSYEIQAGLGSSGQFRAIAGNYGAFLRNDGSNTYFLLTNSGDQYGSWNGLRPFTINNANGYVSVGGATQNGPFNVTGTGQTVATIQSNGSWQSDWPAGWGGGLAGWDMNVASIHYTSLSQRSDIRYKKDVNLLMNTDSITRLMDLKPVSYYWKDAKKGTGMQFGFIAQDVEKVYPNLILKDGNGYLSLDYVGLIAPIVSSLQGQEQEIATLKSKFSLTADGDIALKDGDVFRGSRQVTDIGGFAKLVVARLQAGVIEVQKVIVNGIDLYQELMDAKKQLREQDMRIQDLERKVNELQKANK